MKRGLAVAVALSLLGFFAACRLLLYADTAPKCARQGRGCGGC